MQNENNKPEDTGNQEPQDQEVYDLDYEEEQQDNLDSQEDRKPGTFYPGDPRINRHGRPIIPKSRRKTSREKKLDDLSLLMRRVKPQAADAFRQMQQLMMGKNGTPHAQQFQAAKFVLEFYKELAEDIHEEHQQERKEREEIKKLKLQEKNKVLENNQSDNNEQAVFVDWRPAEE